MEYWKKNPNETPKEFREDLSEKLSKLAKKVLGRIDYGRSKEFYQMKSYRNLQVFT